MNKVPGQAHQRGRVRIGFNTGNAACAVFEAALGQLLSEVLADPAKKLFGMSCGGMLNLATRDVAALSRSDLEVISVMGGPKARTGIPSRYYPAAGIVGRGAIAVPRAQQICSREGRDTIMQLNVFREVVEKLRGVDARAQGSWPLCRMSAS